MSMYGCKRATVQFIALICYTRIATVFLLLSWAMAGQSLVNLCPTKWNPGYATDIHPPRANASLPRTFTWLTQRL